MAALTVPAQLQASRLASARTEAQLEKIARSFQPLHPRDQWTAVPVAEFAVLENAAALNLRSVPRCQVAVGDAILYFTPTVTAAAPHGPPALPDWYPFEITDVVGAEPQDWIRGAMFYVVDHITRIPATVSVDARPETVEASGKFLLRPLDLLPADVFADPVDHIRFTVSEHVIIVGCDDLCRYYAGAATVVERIA